MESVLILGLITFFLLYILFPINGMDDLFGGKDSHVAVNIFLLDDLQKGLKAKPNPFLM